MSEIVKFYTEQVPKMKLVGRAYKEKDKVNNTFGHIWQQWFEQDLFEPLKALARGDDSFIGLSLCTRDDYVYMIGMFLPLEAEVPEGYESLELEKGTVGVCWVKGKEPDVYFHCCLGRLKEEGYSWAYDNGHSVCFERYVCPRFTQADEDGNIILDQCFYLQ